MTHANPLNRIFRPALKSCARIAGLGMFLTGSVFALEEANAPAVGEVSLVLGKAYVEKQDGTRELIKVGTAINVSDRIETGTNGHVHIRFVDRELVSVRPASRLEILRYDYDADAPENSVVKMKLLEGVTRAISGEAAEAARENFRMDTPIAAIGVRGTDFVVSSNSDGVRARVNEGAIVIAPYSAECSAAAFGPCSLNALELAGGANQIVQISANTNEAMLLSLSAPAIPEDSVAPEITTAAATTETQKKDEVLYTESVISRPLTQGLAIAKNSGPPVPPPIAALPEFTPDISVSAESLKENQLIWGRWYDATSELERITVQREIAKDGRKIAVIDDRSIYGLYRIENGSNEVMGGLGVLGFNLKQAQATFTANGQSGLMNVTGGTLDIDFSQSRYSTSLQMNHAATGNVEFSDSGRIFGGGYFHSNDRSASAANSSAGAVSLDGTEAGYFFEKTLESGIIEGLTLWGVKP